MDEHDRRTSNDLPSHSLTKLNEAASEVDPILLDALRALPSIDPPDRVWTGVRDRLPTQSAGRTGIGATKSGESRPRSRESRPRSVESQSKQSNGIRYWPVSLAASVLIGAAALWLAVGVEPDRNMVDADIAALLERSRTVEAARRAGPALLPSNVEQVILARIGGVDARLNDQLVRNVDPGERHALMRERVALMEGLHDIERYRVNELVHLATF